MNAEKTQTRGEATHLHAGLNGETGGTHGKGAN